MKILKVIKALKERRLVLENREYSDDIGTRIDEIDFIIELLEFYLIKEFSSQPELNQKVIHEHYWLLSSWRDIMSIYDIEKNDIKNIMLQYVAEVAKSELDFDID